MAAILNAAGQPISANDNSGIDGPDSALENVTPILHALPAPGWQVWRVSKNTIDPDDLREGESPPSPPASIDVPFGYFARVRPPQEHTNWLPNPEATTRNPDALQTPASWYHTPGTGVTPNWSVQGVQEFADVSGSAATYDPIATGLINVAAKPTITNRVVIEIAGYVTGAVQYVLRQFSTSALTPFTDTVLATLNTVGEHEIITVIAGAAGSGVDRVWQATLVNAQFLIRHNGVVSGVRHLTSRSKNFGVVLGKGHPRKRKTPSLSMPAQVPPDAPIYYDPATYPPLTSPPLEPPETPYPTYGYTTVVLDPPVQDRPILNGVPGTYVPGNMIEYYGPDGTPVTSTFFMSGMKLPVKPGEIRTISAHFFWEGVDAAATPLKAILKDQDGNTLQDLGAFEGMSGITGFSRGAVGVDVNGWKRKKITVNVPSPSTASYIELTSGGCGDGLIRVMGFQNELGSIMTDFTTAHASSGSLTSTFDMGVPGVPQGALKTLSGVKRLVRMGATVLHDTGGATSHIVEARSKAYEDGDWPRDPITDEYVWVDNVADLEINDQIQIRTTLSTSDLDVTPVLHEHFLDFEREFPLGRGFGSLCRADGTEFDGTAILYNFPPVRNQKPITEEEFADHSRGFGVMGVSTDWARGFGVEFALNSASEDFMRLQGQGAEAGYAGDEDAVASVFVAEYLGKRYALRILDAEVQPDDREGHDPITGMENEGRWLMRAEGIEAEVLGVQNF